MCSADFVHPLLGPEYLPSEKLDSSVPLSRDERKLLEKRQAICNTLIAETVAELKAGEAPDKVALRLMERQKYPVVVLVPGLSDLRSVLTADVAELLDAFVWQFVEAIPNGLVSGFGPDSDASWYSMA